LLLRLSGAGLPLDLFAVYHAAMVVSSDRAMFVLHGKVALDA